MKAAAYIRLKRRRWRVELRHVAVLVLIAFNLQAYIAQSHIEGWQLRVSDGLIQTHSAPAKAPSTGHQGHLQCPLCLAVLHAGAFMGPAPLLWLTPSLWMHVALTMLNVQQRRPALAHIWRSRAPPAF
jgi:hypothetical protein